MSLNPDSSLSLSALTSRNFAIDSLLTTDSIALSFQFNESLPKPEPALNINASLIYFVLIDLDNKYIAIPFSKK